MKVRCFLASAMLAVCVAGFGQAIRPGTSGFISLKEASINSSSPSMPTQMISSPKVTTQQNTSGNCNTNNNTGSSQ